MKKYNLLYFSIFFFALFACKDSSKSCFCNYRSGEPKQIQITSCNDTSALAIWWKYSDLKKCGLPYLLESNDCWHFRISNSAYCVDIWTNNFNVFSGTIAYFTSPNNDTEKDSIIKEDPEKLYFKVDSIDHQSAKHIYALIKSDSILEIPSSEKMTGWNQMVLDAIIYKIEFTTPEIYSLKCYVAPDFFESKITQARSINNFIQKLDTTLNIRRSFEEFTEELPRGCYCTESINITCNDIPELNKTVTDSEGVFSENEIKQIEKAITDCATPDVRIAVVSIDSTFLINNSISTISYFYWKKWNCENGILISVSEKEKLLTVNYGEILTDKYRIRETFPNTIGQKFKQENSKIEIINILKKIQSIIRN